MRELTLFFLLLLICVLDGKQFRFDYKYYPAIEGWLKLHRVPAVWHEARLRCHYEGAILVSPVNEHFLAAMKNSMMEFDEPPCAVFTGIHATFSKGDYFSIEGIPLSRIPVRWAPNEPDNYENSEDCLAVTSNGTMADVKCTDVFPYICYKKKTKTMIVTGCGTVDNDYTLDLRTGSCYKLHHDAKTWSRAYMTCAAEGGYLAIINSEVEAQVIREVFVNSKAVGVGATIGFHDWNEHGIWMTVHGETLKNAGYEKWSKGQPDNATNAGHGQYCGAVYKTGLLDDTWCHLRLLFICEKSPESLLVDDDNQ